MPPRTQTQPTLHASTAAKGKGRAAAPAAAKGLGASGLTADPVEARLKAFDLDSRWGPCVAISRRERWERAAALGLAPPPDVLALLEGGGRPMSLFHGRV